MAIESIGRILFATDFSPYSDRAESMVRYLAKNLGSQVTAIHVIEPIPGLDDDDDIGDFYQDLATRASNKMKALEERFEDIELATVIEKGRRWQAIVEYADTHATDLIVVGSHGVYEDGKPYLGTTSHRVFMGTNIPVMAVRWDDD